MHTTVQCLTTGVRLLPGESVFRDRVWEGGMFRFRDWVQLCVCVLLYTFFFMARYFFLLSPCALYKLLQVKMLYILFDVQQCFCLLT